MVVMKPVVLIESNQLMFNTYLSYDYLSVFVMEEFMEVFMEDFMEVYNQILQRDWTMFCTPCSRPPSPPPYSASFCLLTLSSILGRKLAACFPQKKQLFGKPEFSGCCKQQ